MPPAGKSFSVFLPVIQSENISGDSQRCCWDKKDTDLLTDVLSLSTDWHLTINTALYCVCMRTLTGGSRDREPVCQLPSHCRLKKSAYHRWVNGCSIERGVLLLDVLPECLLSESLTGYDSQPAQSHIQTYIHLGTCQMQEHSSHPSHTQQLRHRSSLSR